MLQKVFEFNSLKFDKKTWNSSEVWLKAGLRYKTIKNIFFLPNLISITIDSSKDRSFPTITGREFL